jgi:carboxypeptidase family protein
MRRLFLVLAALAAGCSSSVAPTNPYDPATPPALQAKATVRGALTSALLPSDEGLAVTLRAGGAVVVSTVTTAGGAFVIPALVPGTYQLEASPTGFVPVSLAVSLAPGQDLDVGPLVLVPLSGDQASALTGTASLGPGLDASGIVVTAVGRGFSTVTGPDGSWRLTVIAGSYTLSFGHPGYSAASLPAVTVTAGQVLAVGDVTLSINPARLTGLVTAERPSGGDAPLEGASVSLDGSGLGAVLTGADGSFSVGNVAAGSWSVRVAAPGHVTATQAVFDLAGGEVRPLGTLRLALARGGVAGTVALADGADPLGAVVEAAGTGRVTFAGVGGAFLLDGLPEGAYQLLARRDGYASASSTVLTVTGGAVTDAGTLTLASDPGSIAGHVDGEVAGGPAGPLAGVLISLDGTSVTAVTDAAGDFTLGGVPAGSYLLRVEKLRYGAATVPVLGLGAGERRTVAPLLLSLARGGLRGRVALADAADASGVVVELTGTGRAATTGASGEFVFDGLLEGVYEVSARHDGYGRAVQGSLQVSAGAVADAGTLTLARQGGAVSIAEAPYTTGTAVTLQLAAAGVSFYRASEDPALAGAPWVAFATGGDSKPFTLADADGAHTIHVQFATSAAGDGASAVLSTSIVLDRQPPVLPALTVGDGTGWSRAADGVVSLALSAQDRPPAAAPGAAVSGLGRMQVVDGTSFAGATWVDYDTSAVHALSPLAEGDHVVSVRFEDRAGNLSAPVSTTVTVDRVAPDSTGLAVRGPATAQPGYTSTGLVTLDLAAADANAGAGGQALSVMLSNTPGFVGARYQPFSPSVSWLLLPGDGLKTVHARFMDTAGNESTPISATITLRTGAPGAPALTVLERDGRPGNGATNRRDFDVTLSADGGPVLALLADNPALTGAVAIDLAGKVLPHTTDPALLLADADGAHTLWVRYYDAAGNASEPAAASVVLDRAPPLPVVPAVAPSPHTALPALQLTAPAAGQDDLRLEGPGLASTPTAWQAAPAGALVPVALEGTDGAKAFTVTYRDLADNQTTVAVPPVLLDRGAPVLPGSFAVRGALADGTASTTLTTSPAVTLDLSGVTDGGSGVVEMMVSESPTFAGAAWQPFAASLAFALSPGDGPKTVNARFRDAVGNTSGTVSGTTTLDTTGPTSPSLVLVETDGLQNGFTNQAAVRVTLNAAGGAVRALVAGNPAMTGAATVTLTGQTLPYTTPAAVLSLAAPDGPKTVYARFLDGAGNLSELATATVAYDTTPPLALAPVVSPSPYAGSTSITITPPAAGQDELSVGGTGVVAKAFAAAPAGVPVPASLTGADGPKQVLLTYRDLAGNTTALPAVTVTLDATPPSASDFTVTGLLADGLPSSLLTATSSVTLGVSGQADATSGVAELQVSNDSGFAGASWQPYPVTGEVAWVLTPGDGSKTVYARFRDRAGNVSGQVRGQITLHEAAPSGGLLVIEGGAAFTNKSRLSGQGVSLALLAAGAAEMRVTVDGVPGAWEPYATSKQVTLDSPPEGSKVVSVLFRSDSRVEGAGASASIALDTTPPALTGLSLLGTLADSQTSTGYAAGPVLVANAGWSGADAGVGQIAFVEGAGCAFGGTPTWRPAAPASTVVLSAGDGARALCAKLRDEAGNESTPVSAAITLDSAAPPNPTFSDLPGQATNQPAVTGTVAALALDPGGTALEYQCVGGQYGTAWTACTLGVGRTLGYTLAPNQDNVLGVRTRDAAHNVSTGTLVTVTHDDVAPAPPRLDAVTTSVDAVTLRWTPSADTDVVNTLVYYGNTAADLSGVGAAQGASPVAVGSAVAAQYVLTGLATGTPYYLSVAAVDRAGNVSGRSALLAAVPNVANPRLLSSIGGKPRGVAVAASGAATYAYLAENLAVLQLDVSNDAAGPVLRGRANLDNFAPLDQQPAAVSCTLAGVAGHCVAVVGSTLEGDFRGAQAGHRTSTPVVFFPGAGGAGTVAALLPSASLFVAAGTLSGVPVVLSADADRLRLYSLEDPAAPRLRAVAPWSATAGQAPSVATVAAVELTGTRALAVADGQAFGFQLSQALASGAVAVSAFGAWDGIAHAGSLVRDWLEPAVCIDEPDCYNYIGPWEYLAALDPWTGVSSNVSVPVLDGGGASAWMAGGGAVWFKHPQVGHGAAYHTHLTAPGVLGPVTVLDLPQLNGMRGGAVGVVGGVEHVYVVRTDPSSQAETLEVGAGAATPTFSTPYRELPTDRFAVRGGHVYLADGGTLRVLSVTNPLQPALVASVTGSAGATYFDVIAGPTLLVVPWSKPGSVYGADYFLATGASTSFIGSTAGQVTSAAVAGNVLVTTGITPVVETAVYTWTSAGVFTKRASVGTWLTAMAVRREVRGGTQVYVIYGVDNNIPSRFQTYTYNPATFALTPLSAPVTIPGTFAALGRGSLAVVERHAIYSEERSSWRLDVLDPANPVPAAANGTAVAGRIALQGGYLAGLASSGGANGPVLATMSGGTVDASLPFTGCAAPGSFEAVGALQYASCHRNGLIIASLANPGATSVLKQYGGIFHGGAHDGLSSWGSDFIGGGFRVDESVNAEGTPVAPVSGVAVPQGSWLVHAAGWVFAARAGALSSYFVTQSGALQASGSTTFTAGADACGLGNGAVTDGRTVWVCHAGGVTPVSVVDPSAPVAGTTLVAPNYPTTLHYDGHLWVGSNGAIYQYDVSGAAPSLVRTWPAAGEVTGIAPSAGGVFWTNGYDLLARSLPGGQVTVHDSPLRLSNPVVAGDLLYVLENRTLLSFDLGAWLVSGGAPVRLTPTAVDATAVGEGLLWIDGPFAYGVTSQSFFDGSYRAFDLR